MLHFGVRCFVRLLPQCMPNAGCLCRLVWQHRIREQSRSAHRRVLRCTKVTASTPGGPDPSNRAHNSASVAFKYSADRCSSNYFGATLECVETYTNREHRAGSGKQPVFTVRKPHAHSSRTARLQLSRGLTGHSVHQEQGEVSLPMEFAATALSCGGSALSSAGRLHT